MLPRFVASSSSRRHHLRVAIPRGQIHPGGGGTDRRRTTMALASPFANDRLADRGRRRLLRDDYRRNDDASGTTRIMRRRFRGTASLRLNRILFDVSEIDGVDDEPPHVEGGGSSSRHRSHLATVTLPKDDYRTVHVARVLGLRDGDTLRAGAVRCRRSIPDRVVDVDGADRDGDDSRRRDRLAGLITDDALVSWLPEGKVKKAEPTRNGDPPGSLRISIPLPPHTSLWDDRVAVERSREEEEEEEDENDDDDDAAPEGGRRKADQRDCCDELGGVPRVSLLLALPRPLQLRRILPMACQLGLDRIVLSNARKVPKDYFGSSLFRKPETLRGLLVEGLAISGDVSLPDVVITRKLRAFLEDELDDMFPPGEVARVIAHPTRRVDVSGGGGDGTDEDDEDVGGGQATSKRMSDVVFPNVDGKGPRRMLVAIGPEGGWEEPYELDMFERLGFQRVSLGSRVLRSDVAVVSLLALAHECCASDSSPS